MTKQNDEKKVEDSVELSLDDLEDAAGGVIIETEDGRYVTKDEFNGRVYYIGDSLELAKEFAGRHDISTRVMAKSEYERRTRK